MEVEGQELENPEPCLLCIFHAPSILTSQDGSPFKNNKTQKKSALKKSVNISMKKRGREDEQALFSNIFMTKTVPSLSVTILILQLMKLNPLFMKI